MERESFSGVLSPLHYYHSCIDRRVHFFILGFFMDSLFQFYRQSITRSTTIYQTGHSNGLKAFSVGDGD